MDEYTDQIQIPVPFDLGRKEKKKYDFLRQTNIWTDNQLKKYNQINLVDRSTIKLLLGFLYSFKGYTHLFQYLC